MNGKRAAQKLSGFSILLIAVGDERFDERDEVCVRAFRLQRCAVELRKDAANAVDCDEYGGNADFGGGRSVAQFADQCFGGMGEVGEPGQTEKSAGALDGMNKAKDRGDDAPIRRLAFKLHKLRADRFNLVARLDEKFLENVVHCIRPPAGLQWARKWIQIAAKGLREPCGKDDQAAASEDSCAVCADAEMCGEAMIVTPSGAASTVRPRPQARATRPV